MVISTADGENDMSKSEVSIITTGGLLVTDKMDGTPLTLAQAEQSVADRNRRAEEMGLVTRYEVRDGAIAELEGE